MSSDQRIITGFAIMLAGIESLVALLAGYASSTSDYIKFWSAFFWINAVGFAFIFAIILIAVGASLINSLESDE